MAVAMGCLGLRRWPRELRYLLVASCIANVMNAITQGAIFDAYLLETPEGSNTFVGAVESARGLATLLVAIPIGWAVDRWSKFQVLRWNCLMGLGSCALLAVGVPRDNLALIIAGSVTSGMHMQGLAGTVPAVISELTTQGDERTCAMGDAQTWRSLGTAAGPTLQLALTLVLRTSTWNTEELHWIICFGLLLFPLYVAVIFLAQAPEGERAARELTVWDDRAKAQSGVAPPGGAGDAPMPAAAGPRPPGSLLAAEEPATTCNHWLVAIFMEVNALLTVLGSGMTFKFWPLFFKQDYGFSPSAVCALQAAVWFAVAATSKVTPLLARRFGRMRMCILSFYVATGLLFVVSLTSLPAWMTVIMVLARNATMNANTPILQAVVLDMVPHRHRGKWSAIASLKRTSWSGSAFVGGILSDHHDYRFAFTITACVHSVAGLLFVPAAMLMP